MFEPERRWCRVAAVDRVVRTTSVYVSVAPLPALTLLRRSTTRRTAFQVSDDCSAVVMESSVCVSPSGRTIAVSASDASVGDAVVDSTTGAAVGDLPGTPNVGAVVVGDGDVGACDAGAIEAVGAVVVGANDTGATVPVGATVTGAYEAPT